MKKILLLNLPFERPVQRDYGCPHGAKADYSWPPIDLLLFGAMARDAGELGYIDCLAGKLAWTECLRRINDIQPDLIFTMISSITLTSDLERLNEVRNAVPMARIWASGDLVFFTTEKYAQVDVYVRDLTNRSGILGMLNSDVTSGVVEEDSQAPFSCGIFPHELLRGYDYAMPYSLYRGITSVLTNYGCPFPCTFCNSNRIPFKKRDIDEIVHELLHIQQVGIREVIFRDFTFNLSDVDQLCDKIKRNNIRLAWSCWSRADLVDAHVLHTMKEAGCYLISYGVESGDDDILARTHKQLDTKAIQEAVRLTRVAGIEVLISVIFGFPGEDPVRTQRYVRKLDPDYLAVNLLAKRTGSAATAGIPNVIDQQGCDSLISADPEQMRLRDRVEKSFYLRPGKILRCMLLALKSPHRILIFFNNARALINKWKETSKLTNP